MFSTGIFLTRWDVQFGRAIDDDDQTRDRDFGGAWNAERQHVSRTAPASQTQRTISHISDGDSADAEGLPRSQERGRAMLCPGPAVACAVRRGKA